MFLGHFGVALALKPAAPRVSLATLYPSAQIVDLLWPVLLLTVPLDFVQFDLLVHPADRVAWALVALVAFLAIIHVGNIFGSPPPSAEAIAWVGHAQWLFVIWAYWADRHRRARGSAVPWPRRIIPASLNKWTVIARRPPLRDDEAIQHALLGALAMTNRG